MSGCTRVCNLIVFLLGLTIGGCAAPLPTYPWTDSQAALAVMATRADSIKTFSSPCTIYIQRKDGYSVSLDGAAVAQVPGWLRIRAWKFGNAVLDLTVTPDGVWLLRERGDSGDPAATPESGPKRLAEAWSLLSGRFFDEPGLRVLDQGGARFTVERPLSDGRATVSCEIDRPTLTARSFVITESGGAVRLRLALERYRQFGDVVWPRRLVADISPSAGAAASRSEPSRIVIAFEDPEINPELPAGAFVPPKRAVKQP